MISATRPAADARPVRLVERLAPWLPILALAYPLLVWPLLEGRQSSEFADLMPAQVDNAGSALNRLYFAPLLVISLGLFLMARPEERRRLLHPAMLMLAVFLAWAGLSGWWALDPDISSRRFLLEVAIVGSVVLPFALIPDPRQVLDRFFLLKLTLVGINALWVATHAPGPLGHEGIYPQKNFLGGVMAFSCLIATYQLAAGTPWRRLAAAAMLPAAFALLVLSRSKTSLGLALMVPALALLVALLWRHLRLSPALTVGFAALALLGLYRLGADQGFWDFGDVAEALTGDRTFTERTQIWDFALRMIERRPWLGWGYQSFWQIGYEAPSFREAPGFVAKMPHAHNGYIDVALQTGLVGLGLLALLILASLSALGRVLDRSLAVGWILLAMVLMALLINTMEAEFFRGYSDISMKFLAATAAAVAMRAVPR